MKRKILLIIGICLALCMVGCGAPDPVDEKQMLQDIQGEVQVNEEDVTVESLVIDDRKTDTENKEDMVFVTVEGKNDKVSCKIGYIMKYRLYDQGWSLDDAYEYSEGVWEVKPLAGPTDEEAIARMDKDDAVLKSREDDLENGTSKFIFSYTQEKKHCTMTTKTELNYNFDETTGKWAYGEEVEAGVETVWHIEGTWEAHPVQGLMGGGWCEGIVAEISNVTSESADLIVREEGNIVFSGTVVLDPEEGLNQEITNQENSWYTYDIMINAEKALAVARGTRSNGILERQ